MPRNSSKSCRHLAAFARLNMDGFMSAFHMSKRNIPSVNSGAQRPSSSGWPEELQAEICEDGPIQPSWCDEWVEELPLGSWMFRPALLGRVGG